jgi:hypothetical protein
MFPQCPDELGCPICGLQFVSLVLVMPRHKLGPFSCDSSLDAVYLDFGWCSKHTNQPMCSITWVWPNDRHDWRLHQGEKSTHPMSNSLYFNDCDFSQEPSSLLEVIPETIDTEVVTDTSIAHFVVIKELCCNSRNPVCKWYHSRWHLNFFEMSGFDSSRATWLFHTPLSV